MSPVTGNELLMALERIDASKLNIKLKTEYNNLISEIKYGSEIFRYKQMGLEVALGINLSANIASYTDFDFSNASGFATPRNEEGLIPYRLESPFLYGNVKLSFGSFIALEGQVDIRNNNHHMYESTLGWLFNNYNNTFYHFGMKRGTHPITSLPLDFPYKANASFGNDFISFKFGRMPHSLGRGITGNLMIGDNFRYQEVTTLSFFNRYFTYNISITSFDNEIPTSNTQYELSKAKFSDPRNFRVLHQFDIDILDKIRITIDLATMFHSASILDLRFFYPFMFNHNYGNYTNELEKESFDEANNSIGFSLEAALGGGFSLYGYFLLDQAQTIDEKATSVPISYGFQVNLQHSVTADIGSFNSYFEFVYTNPYLYLNGKKDSDGILDSNLDYIAGYSAEFLDEIGYSGYVFGPDSIVAAAGTSYSSPNKVWKITADLLYRIKGQMCYRYKGSYIYNDDLKHAQTIVDLINGYVTKTDGSNTKKTPSGGLDRAEHLLKPTISCRLDTGFYGISLYSIFTTNFYWNYDNIIGKTKILPAFTIGVKWTGIESAWFKK